MKKAATLLKLVVSRQRLIPLLFLFTIFYLLFTNPVHAQTPPCQPSSDGLDYGQVVKDVNRCARSENLNRDQIFNWNQITATVDSINTLITGRSFIHPETNAITAETGALAGLAKAITLTYAAPPVSGVEYITQQIHNFNPLKPAYAQAPGYGFKALEPVQKIWAAFRNFAYIAFIVVFVVIGFMIMFRHKISPQAVATVQDSLPRIVIALILVTFSYAIAGLMVDMMYIFLNLAITVLASAGLDAEQAQIVFRKNILGVITDGWGGMVDTASGVVADLLRDLFNKSLNGTGCKIDDLGSCTVSVFASIFGWIAGIIFGLAILFIVIKVFFMLLQSYVLIIILTIFSPFLFLFHALPGNNGAKEWFKQTAANLAVFPTVALMFLLAGLLGGIGAYGGNENSTFGTESQLFQAPLLSAGFDPTTLGKLVAIGIILMTPEAAKMVKERFGVKGGLALGGAGLAAVGAAAGFTGRRAAGSPFGQAAKGLAQYRSENWTAGLMNKAPGILKGRGSGTFTRGTPTWERK